MEKIREIAARNRERALEVIRQTNIPALWEAAGASGSRSIGMDAVRCEPLLEKKYNQHKEMASKPIEKLLSANPQRVLLLNLPDGVEGFDFAYDTEYVKKEYDLIIAFVFRIEDFRRIGAAVAAEERLAQNGYLYFVYPKKGNKKYAEYIGRDEFLAQPEVDEQGYVSGSRVKFCRMMAFDETFTVVGLKRQPENTKTPARPSQCVADYEGRIPELRQQLDCQPEALALFDALTPGYRRDWARYVYSAQTAATTAKRLAEMISILTQGYKTKDHYRQQKK